MRNATVNGPPTAGAFIERPLEKGTDFRKFYERGDLPIALEHDTKGNKIAWKVSNSNLINWDRTWSSWDWKIIENVRTSFLLTF